MALPAELSPVGEVDDGFSVVIAGAGNVEKQFFSRNPVDVANALAAFRFLHGEITERLHDPAVIATLTTTPVVVPEWYGFGRPEKSYQRTAPKIDRAVAEADGRPIELTGFSLGGVIAVQYALDHPEANIRKVATADSPFGGTPAIPLSGRFFRRMTGAMADQLEDLGDDVFDLRLVGSEGDLFVPPKSSLPDLPGAKRVIFTHDPDSARANGLIPHSDVVPAELERRFLPGHIDMHSRQDYLHALVSTSLSTTIAPPELVIVPS